MADQTQKKGGYVPPKGATPLHGASQETFKWDDPGKHLEGVFVGLEDGSMGGKLIIIQTPGGKERASAPLNLERAVEGIKPGTKLAIEYTGEVKAQSGRMVKTFNVWAL